MQAIITEKFRIPYEEFARIVRAKTMQLRTDYIVGLYWPKEERINLYRHIPQHAPSGKKVSVGDLLEIKGNKKQFTGMIEN